MKHKSDTSGIKMVGSVNIEAVSINVRNVVSTSGIDNFGAGKI